MEYRISDDYQFIVVMGKNVYGQNGAGFSKYFRGEYFDYELRVFFFCKLGECKVVRRIQHRITCDEQLDSK